MKVSKRTIAGVLAVAASMNVQAKPVGDVLNRTDETSVLSNQSLQQEDYSHLSAKQLYAMGNKYYTPGKFLDYEKAAEFFQRAADEGSAEAMNNLGNLYHDGHGVEKNLNTALRLYEESAKLGNFSALENIGRAYEYGYGVPVDYEKALSLYEESYQKGHSNALFRIGIMHIKGHGFEKNEAKGLRLIERAAEEKSSMAIKYLEDRKLGKNIPNNHPALDEHLAQNSFGSTFDHPKNDLK